MITTLMGQPIQTWRHVVETDLLEETETPNLDRKMLLLMVHEAILLLEKRETEAGQAVARVQERCARIAENMAIPGHAVQAPSCQEIAKRIRSQITTA